MRKLSVLVLFAMIISLAGCKPDSKSSEDKSSQSSANSQISSAVDSSVAEKPETIKAKEVAKKFFPFDFQEDIDIEAKRQEVLLTGSRADMGIATDEAFSKMKLLYNSYCEKIKALLNDNQKKAFDDLLTAEKEYSIHLDMFSFKTLSQQVFTNGNADCSEAYNILRSNAISMYYYYNNINKKTADINNLNSNLYNQIGEYLFFNSELPEIKAKSSTELTAIYNQTVPLITLSLIMRSFHH